MANGNDSQQWVRFLTWALGLTLTAVISLQAALYHQMTAKIDRVTGLFIEERNRLLQMLELMRQVQTCHEAELRAHKEAIEVLKSHHHPQKK